MKNFDSGYKATFYHVVTEEDKFVTSLGSLPLENVLPKEFAESDKIKTLTLSSAAKSYGSGARSISNNSKGCGALHLFGIDPKSSGIKVRQFGMEGKQYLPVWAPNAEQGVVHKDMLRTHCVKFFENTFFFFIIFFFMFFFG